MTGEGIAIHKCRHEDARAVLALWAEARSDHASTADRLADVERLIEDSPAALLVAERDGEIVGALIAAWDGWRGNIYRLAVAEGHRRQGIGLALTRAGEEYLHSRGARRITALVAFDDKPAGAFWESAGYPRDQAIGRRVRNLYSLLLAFAACLTLCSGCGEGSHSDDTTALTTPGARTPPALAAGSKVRDCDITFDGPGPADWRARSLWIGPFGLAGRDGPDFDAGVFEDGLLTVKTPTMVEGHRPVTIYLPPAERDRVGILGVHPRPAYASVTYMPCDDKPRTVFAAGLLLRDRRPVTLLVQAGDGPVRRLHLDG